MSNTARLTFKGLDELRAELRGLPRELATDGGVIVSTAARAAYDLIQAGYDRHEVTGYLSEHLVIAKGTHGAYGSAMRVRNSSPHAYLFEIGNQGKIRRYKGASRGAMPPGRVFIPNADRSRRHMIRNLVQLLERKGLRVSGSE